MTGMVGPVMDHSSNNGPLWSVGMLQRTIVAIEMADSVSMDAAEMRVYSKVQCKMLLREFLNSNLKV